jgi:hypothetical protein
MTQIADICKSLLRGEVLTIMSGFTDFGCTNISRELSRSVEQKFGVTVSKTRKDFVSKYGHSGYYFQYRLNKSEHNKEGIEKMKLYLQNQKNKS